MIATNVRGVSLLAHEILMEELGQSIVRVVHARNSRRFWHTVRGRVVEGNVAHHLGIFGVNLESSGKSSSISKSFTEIIISAIYLLRACHPSHVVLIIKVDYAVEQANDIRIVVIFESSYIKYTKLPQAFINVVKVILNVVVEVSHVGCMLMHNPAPLEISLVRIVFIPHLLLPLYPEQLFSPSVDSLLEAIRIDTLQTYL
jgi:hypothetical protein